MLRRWLFPLGVFVTVVALGIPAHAVPPPSGPAHDSVQGTGETLNGLFRDIVVEARSDPVGGEPSGSVSFVVVIPAGEAPIRGPVSCLAVDGQRAVIGFVDTAAGLGPITVVVTDNGSTGSPPDTFNASPEATNCAVDPGLSPSPLSSGDFVVRDAPSKAQCFDGGWRNYTDASGTPFRSQGDCIAFALRGV